MKRASLKLKYRRPVPSFVSLCVFAFLLLHTRHLPLGYATAGSNKGISPSSQRLLPRQYHL